MESNRIWHEPEVVIYSGIITPGINVNSGVYDEEWMADTFENHISTYYHDSGKQTPFNVINATVNGSLKFDTKPDHAIARPIREKLQYYSEGKSAIPAVLSINAVGMIKTAHSNGSSSIATSRLLTEKSRAGKDCWKFRIFTAWPTKTPTSEDANQIMEHRFNVIPILAVVVIEQDVNNEVMGIPMPFGGPIPKTLRSREDNFEITRGQLRDLARGVREPAQVGVVHGDINERNTLKKPHEVNAAEGYQEQNRLVLADFGDVAPEYKSDAFALGELFIWCKERSSWGVSDLRKIEDAAQVLKENGDFDRALSVLDDERDT
ncbi:hypothetical protein DL95DRAFT_454568 [Leptodontidium sp. 2 PMI_412]|nr:hypothetical protein DL95DRAFT_454568 [Leptodontidium sp. 2 PMI_412]